jgi:hypothetical protein
MPAAWEEYRRRSRVAMFGLLGLPLAVLVGMYSFPLIGPNALGLFIALTVVWLVWWPWAAFRLVRWPCPGCGIPFLSYQEPWVRQCSKCGLKLYGDP